MSYIILPTGSINGLIERFADLIARVNVDQMGRDLAARVVLQDALAEHASEVYPHNRKGFAECKALWLPPTKQSVVSVGQQVHRAVAYADNDTFGGLRWGWRIIRILGRQTASTRGTRSVTFDRDGDLIFLGNETKP